MRAIDLAEREALDPAAVGHKAANLARFAASFRVPPAFCLSTSVYDELRPALTPEGASEREALRLCVADAYERLAGAIGTRDPRVAVRSSATGEDSGEASYAGQHETILNVSGVDAVVDAVLECWRSAGNERVAAYRKEKGIDAAVQVAVLVQQMVDADTSAIAFGVDPVSGDTEIIVIDAAQGLGDKIAAGEITPDHYTVRKSDLQVSGPALGALDEPQARAIAKLTLALERENGHPVDVECAFAEGELYLLQCRPITTLSSAFPVQWRKPEDATLHWRRDDAHLGEPVPRLIGDVTERGPSAGLQRRAEIFDLPLSPRAEPFSGRTYTTAERRITTGDMDEIQKRSTARVRADARIGRKRWDEEHLPALRAHYAWFEERTGAVPTVARADLPPIWDEAWRRFGEVWVMHMMTVHAAFAGGDELSSLYETLTGGSPLDALKLTQGRAHTLHQLERDLEKLAAIRASGDTTAFDTALRAFVATPHGNLGNAGEDARKPTWRDDPSLLVAELDRRIAAKSETAETRHARLVADGDAVEARTRELLRDRPEDLARFEEVLAHARAVAPLTEEHNYHLDRQIQGHMRRLFLAVGARMVTDAQLEATEDVYYFHMPEVLQALRDGRPMQDQARARASEYASWRRLRHPRTIGAAAGPISALSTRTDLNYRTKQDEAGVIKGIAASAGLGRGRACLVRGAHEFEKLKPGDVLVCRSSNVSWIPLFTVAAAIVTDVGGSLSHAAVVAREFGVPAVTGCSVALEQLRDGELVEVDGDAGTVRRVTPRE